jgi:MFS family permease
VTPADDRTRWLALYVLCLGSLMIVLDATIVNVALPSIRQDLGFTETSLAWVVNAYLLTYGGLLLLGGRLGDLLGHRRMFIYGITLFTLSSLACGLSTSQGMLVVARAVQGVGGAVASAVSLSLIMVLFTETGERAKAMGFFGFVASGGGTLGVLLGGVLTDSLSWHWIFLVNVPIGVVVCALCLRVLPAAHGARGSGRVDVPGAVLVTAALIVATYAIVNGNDNGWTSFETLGLLALAAALLAIFLIVESTRERAAGAAAALPAAQPAHGEHRRCVVGGRDVRMVLHGRAVPAAGARLQPAGGRPRLPAVDPDHGGVLDRPLRAAGHALRHPPAARRRARPGLDRAAALRPRPRRSQLRHRRPAQHDPARLWRGHGVQPAAAGRHERRRPP